MNKHKDGPIQMPPDLFTAFLNGKVAPEIKRAIESTARRFSGRPSLQEEFRQEAWLAIAQCAADTPLRELLREQENAQERAYRANLKARKGDKVSRLATIALMAESRDARPTPRRPSQDDVDLKHHGKGERENDAD